MKANDVKLDDAKREAMGAFLKPGFASGLVPEGATKDELSLYLAEEVGGARAPLEFRTGFAAGLKFALFGIDEEESIGDYIDWSFVTASLMLASPKVADVLVELSRGDG